MGKLTGLTCVVTGASGGMGRELARQLCSEGCRLALCDVRFAELEETRRLCLLKNPRAKDISIHVCDVTDEDGVERFRSEVVAAHGEKIDMLINNAGIASSGSFLVMPKSKFDQVFDVSFKGVVLCTRAFLPYIVKSKRGYVANLSSINAFWCALGPAKWPIKTPPHAAYCAGKAAIRGFTESLMHDAAQNFPHVLVTCIHPGHVGTDIGWLGDKDDTTPPASAEDLFDASVRLGIVQSLEEAKATDPAILKKKMGEKFRDIAPLTASAAATQILDGLRADKTRVLVGEDALILDILARTFPRLIYNDVFIMTILGPWIVSAARIGRPIGRFVYPTLVAGLLYGGHRVVKGLLSRL